MKREIVFYIVLIFAVGALILIQSGYSSKENTEYTKVMDLKPFNKMHINLKYPVYVTRGDDARIVIEGPSRRMEDILLVWQNGELTLGMKGRGILSKLFSWGTVSGDEVNIYIRLPQPSIIDAACTANIITSEDIPGLDSCQHMASGLKASEYMMNPEDQSFSWIMHVAEQFNWKQILSII